MVVETIWVRKAPNLQALVSATYTDRPRVREKITDKVVLPTTEFEYFMENFTEDFDWLEGKKMVVVECEGKQHEPILVCTEGYSYARYTGIIITKLAE